MTKIETKMQAETACPVPAEKELLQIAIVGTGYVGLSIAVLLSQRHKVYAVDVVAEKVDMINRRQSPIDDRELKEYLSSKQLNLTATQDVRLACNGADYVIVAVSTNYDSENNCFDTSAVEAVVRQVHTINPDAIIVIKSTIPVGYTQKLRIDAKHRNILFSPEFLRESKALYDNLYPSRIIVGTDLSDAQLVKAAERFAGLLRGAALKEQVDTLIMGTTEAEAAKLFSNAYLAMRVSYFNELDAYAQMNGLDAKAVINGVCHDPRIGEGYNNPSFGYGGYCLPKDTKQLLASYGAIPQRLVQAIVESNQVRKAFIADQIMERLRGIDKPVVGVYRLMMKSGSDNFRESAVLDIMDLLQARDVDLLVFEPTLRTGQFQGHPVDNDFAHFSSVSDLIIANRRDSLLNAVKHKVYTRDLFGRD